MPRRRIGRPKGVGGLFQILTAIRKRNEIKRGIMERRVGQTKEEGQREEI